MPEIIEKYEFKEGLPQEFEILDLETLLNFASDKLTAPHRAGFYNIICFESGEAEHMVDFMPVNVSPNSILFLNRDIVHRFGHAANLKGKVILFTDRFYCRNEQDAKFLKSSVLFNSIQGAAHININIRLAQVLKQLIILMSDEVKKDKDVRQSLIIHNFLHNFLLLAEREQANQPVHEIIHGLDYDIVVLFRDLLEKGFMQRKLVSDYAREMYITEKRLNQATSKILGKTAKKLTADRMILEAKRLLSHTSKSVKEIGYDLGFDEPTNFIKHFRKHNGLTPIEFKENMQLGTKTYLKIAARK